MTFASAAAEGEAPESAASPRRKCEYGLTLSRAVSVVITGSTVRECLPGGDAVHMSMFDDY